MKLLADFFFFKQKTAYEMRISDWSSDVCSSDLTREALVLTVDTSIGGARVVRELDALIARRGRPATIVSDNGPELTSRAVLEWTNRRSVEWHYIAPGKPTQNARSAEQTSELQSLMRLSSAVVCLKKKKTKRNNKTTQNI